MGGGKNTHDLVFNILRQFFANNLAIKFNMEGSLQPSSYVCNCSVVRIWLVLLFFTYKMYNKEIFRRLLSKQEFCLLQNDEKLHAPSHPVFNEIAIEGSSARRGIFVVARRYYSKFFPLAISRWKRLLEMEFQESYLQENKKNDSPFEFFGHPIQVLIMTDA